LFWPRDRRLREGRRSSLSEGRMNPKLTLGEGLVLHENGVVSPPRVVIDHIHAGYAVIPMTGDKRPLVEEWTPFKERQPTTEEIRKWIQRKGAEIDGWARITGAYAEVIVIDFDAGAADRLHEWNLSPHVMTPSGGYHLLVKHPGWPVKTVNSKSGKKHQELYPNIDIRADGGYSMIAGMESKGGYTWLRDFNDVDELDVLPEEFRIFFGLTEETRQQEVPAPSERVRERVELPGARDGIDGGPTPEHLVSRALVEAGLSGRNNAGYWLAQQLWDHGYDRAEILEVGELYVAQCPATNTKGELEAYTPEDFQKSVDQAIQLPRRDRWGEESTPLLADFGDAVTNALTDGDDDVADIYRYFVPSQVGSQKKYPPWAVQDLVRVGSRVIIYGRSGGGKSYATVDLARAAATGGEWLGRHVLPGLVIYVAAEDHIGIHHRIEATINASGVPRRHDVLVFEQSLPVTSVPDMENFCNAFDLLPEKPAYIIIDNLSLCMGDGDPNEGKDAKRFVDGCQRIQRHRWRGESEREADEHPITVIVVHHTNKQGGFNGSQYFENFVDAMSELVWDRRQNIRTVFAVKQRQGGHHRPLSYDLVEVDSVNGICVVRSRVMADAANDEEHTVSKLNAPDRIMLRILHEAMIERQLRMLDSDVTPPEGLTRGEITLRSRVNARVVRRALTLLRGVGLVETVMAENEDGKWVKTSHPEYLKLTVEGVRVAQSIPEEGLVMNPQDADL